MWNARLHESKAEITIAGRNMNNLKYADDTTLMTEKEEKLKNLLMRVKEESEKADSKLNIKKAKIMASDPIQPSHPLSPSSPALNFCHHQSLFQWVGSSH